MIGWRVVSSVRGHEVYTDDGVDWFYSADDSLYNKQDRACTKCNILASFDKPDPCLGWLDGVDYACCGHGNSTDEYVKVGDTRYDSVEAWRLDTGRATLSDTTHQQEV